MCRSSHSRRFFFFFQAEDGIRDIGVTGVQTCALPILSRGTHPRCPVVASPAPGVFVDSRRESKNRMGIPPPPVFLQKRAQTVENKGSECEKESKEKPRGGKLLKRWSLSKQRRNSAVE